MITNLYIENFVLIDKLNLSFEKGFSAFIGETGAGKSILLDAISLLCGARASTDFISNGCEYTRIEGAFEIERNSYSYNLLKENGFDVDDLLVVTREIDSTGKSVAKINYRPITVNFLKEVMKYEIDIHGQRDSGYLLSEKNHIKLLDAYDSDPDLLQKVSDTYTKYSDILKEKEKAIHETFNETDLEFFKYQLNEIESAKLKIDEDIELSEKEKQYKSLKSSFETYEKIVYLYDELSAPLFELNKMVSKLDDTNANIKIKSTLNDSYYAIDDAINDFKRSTVDLDISEDEINYIEERLYTIQKMKRKYGPSIQDVLNKKIELEQKIEHFEHRQDYLDALDKQEKEAYAEFIKYAESLTKKRKKAAKQLDQQISNQLLDLQLKNAKFVTNISENNPSKTGIDQVTFMISMNNGEDLKPLSKTASGGELSRLMLGLKVIFTKLQGIKTVIFDEIDTGVSGSVATSIGKKMKKLGDDAQVFSVTHLAPVASCCDQMYFVKKKSNEKVTTTEVVQLKNDEIIEQLAFLSSGTNSEASLAAAKELYERNHS